MMKWLLTAQVMLLMLMMQDVHAEFLPPEQAFQLQARSSTQDTAELTWTIAEGYYLYHDQLQVKVQQKAIPLVLPTPQDKDDPTFGMTQVYYDAVKMTIPVQPNQQLHIQWQGCAESGLCYPMQRKTIQVNEDGLLPDQRLPIKNTAFQTATIASPTKEITANHQQVDTDAETKTSTSQQKQDVLESSIQLKQDQAVITEMVVEKPTTDVLVSTEQQPQATINTAVTQQETAAQPELQPTIKSVQDVWNNDQFFLQLLADQNLMVSLFLFLALGILLAFLPCSLPLIPILSGILIQRNTGYKAALIAGVFVLGMAVVYAMMGLVAAQMGYSLQRWLQSPVFITVFAVLFVVFALNLFGVFQLSLPQKFLQRLDQWQQQQKGGTLIGAAVMGMISALIVGPCMSAPLAGALLFVSQLNQPAMGMVYLFVLGLGIGLPLFIAAVFGAHHLPKPGLWMDRLKFSFGFMMLALAIYFVRPLLPSAVYFGLMAFISMFFVGYCLFKILPNIVRRWAKLSVLIFSILFVWISIWHGQQAFIQIQTTQQQHKLVWQKVTTLDEFNAALAQAQGQAMVIDVYADWCVACQPIERDVLPREDVQALLQNVVRLKLDLTHDHPSQNELLKQWQILGPPTMIFLDQQHQEQRNLRLTGTFTAPQFILGLQKLQMEHQP